MDSPLGDNNWKLAELITLGGAFKFLGLLAGFPSYIALISTLGVTGIGKGYIIKVLLFHTQTTSGDQLLKLLESSSQNKESIISST